MNKIEHFDVIERRVNYRFGANKAVIIVFSSNYGLISFLGRKINTGGHRRLDSFNRRKLLLSILKKRGHDTIPNLAVELNVSAKTIRRDLDVLCLNEPITFKTGRYDGGVYYDRTRLAQRTALNQQQINILKRIIVSAEKQEPCKLSSPEIITLYSILADFV